MSATNSRRHQKRVKLANTGVFGECCFLRCAAQLATSCSSDCVRVLLRHQQQDFTNTEDAPDTKSGSIRNGQTEKETNENRKSNTRTHTMIITTTAFSSMPTCSPGKRSLIYVKPLIVLDLNGILCHRIRDRRTDNSMIGSPQSKSRYRRSIGRIANTEIVPRSDLAQFLQLLHQHFALAVWTSATTKTAKALVKILFPDEIRNKLLFIWHRGCCNLLQRGEIDDDGKRKKKKRKRNKLKDANIHVDSQQNVPGNTTEDNSAIHSSNNHDQDLIAIKSISKVWSTYPIWDKTNTLLLDDSPDKCPRSFRGNALHPPPLCGTETMYKNMDEQNSEYADDNVSSENSSSFVSDDEANEKLQYTFFELLAQHYLSCPTNRIVGESLDGTVCSSGKSLNEFLGENACVYNMRWGDS